MIKGGRVYCYILKSKLITYYKSGLNYKAKDYELRL